MRSSIAHGKTRIAAAKLLGQMNFLSRIRSVDKDAIPDKVIDVIRGK